MKACDIGLSSLIPNALIYLVEVLEVQLIQIILFNAHGMGQKKAHALASIFSAFTPARGSLTGTRWNTKVPRGVLNDLLRCIVTLET